MRHDTFIKLIKSVPPLLTGWSDTIRHLWQSVRNTDLQLVSCLILAQLHFASMFITTQKYTKWIPAEFQVTAAVFMWRSAVCASTFQTNLLLSSEYGRYFERSVHIYQAALGQRNTAVKTWNLQDSVSAFLNFSKNRRKKLIRFISNLFARLQVAGSCETSLNIYHTTRRHMSRCSHSPPPQQNGSCTSIFARATRTSTERHRTVTSHQNLTSL